MKRLKKIHILRLAKNFAITAGISTGLLAFVFVPANVITKNFPNEYGYQEFNAQYKQEKIDSWEEQVYDREISIEEYNKKVENLSDYDSIKFMEENHPDDLKKEQKFQDAVTYGVMACTATTLGASLGWLECQRRLNKELYKD